MKNKIYLKIERAWNGRLARYIPHSMNARMHWAMRNRWNKAWYDRVWQSVLENKEQFGGRKLPFEFADITITLRTLRYLDTDNAYTCAKPILDGLKRAGVIIDDSPKYIHLFVTQHLVTKGTDQGVDIYIKK